MKLQNDQLPRISQPAMRALDLISVTKASQLKKYTEQDLLALHGFGPKSIRIIKEAGIQLREKE